MNGRRRVLVVGGGSIGERHARCFLATGQTDVALCEVDDARRESVASRCGVTETYHSLGEALDQRPEAVVIATPAHLHIPMAVEAVRRNCHVLIEKPLSTSLTGVDELQKLAVFGRPLQVVSVSGQDFPFYRPAYRETYYTCHETGGGAVQDALTHIINAAEWLVGPIDRLTADAAHLALPGVTVEDTVNVLARHGDILGSYSLNQHQAPNESTITVVCERGTVRFEYHHSRWRWVTEAGGEWQDEIVGPLERDSLFVAQARTFLSVLDGSAPAVCSLAEAAQTLRVNLAILESVRTNSWQSVSSI
ncbi:MAG: hypothetical protein B7Z55_12015 [Planctomycetales bacterium 12-60-4]|nr:MAG: hypothetical protein B7Z55_12015 [Planctomycetales bacterium 12-60-4]